MEFYDTLDTAKFSAVQENAHNARKAVLKSPFCLTATHVYSGIAIYASNKGYFILQTNIGKFGRVLLRMSAKYNAKMCSIMYYTTDHFLYGFIDIDEG